MREMNNVDKLSLEWSRSSTPDNSEIKRDIVDAICPHTNTKAVEIRGYRGINFPNWLADPSFLKLVELGMHGITEVTEEFYGSSTSKKSFNSLEKLEFEDMPKWKQCHVLGNGELLALEKLSIQNCPKLIWKLLENLTSLTELIISRCRHFANYLEDNTNILLPEIEIGAASW
nr:putative disease resistance RPP13-like protein 1 [Solanum lycopersicum]